MKEQHKKWQTEWRQIMGKPTNVQVEPNCDFDLHFDIWNLEKDQFFELFKNFPKGKEIAERAYQLRWGEITELKKDLNEDELISETKDSISILQQICPSEELDDPKITFRYGNYKLRLELSSRTDPISIKIDDEISTLIKDANGEEGYNAFFFLSEPMYRLSSSYVPRNWILWTLTNLESMNPYTSLLKLEYNKCDAALTDNGVLIFKRIDEQQNTPGSM